MYPSQSPLGLLDYFDHIHHINISLDLASQSAVSLSNWLIFQVPVQPIEPPSLDTQYSTIHKSPSRRKSRAMARSVPGTLDRRGGHDMMDDGLDMPLTPASFAGLDHKDLGERPLTSMTARMGKCTMYDDPPEK